MSISGLSCIFPSPDIKKTAGFYVSKLGFRAVEYLKSTEPHIGVCRGYGYGLERPGEKPGSGFLMIQS